MSGSYPIPYPKRDFLSEDDAEEKPDTKQRDRNSGENIRQLDRTQVTDHEAAGKELRQQDRTLRLG
jgi:hypothetical protein